MSAQAIAEKRRLRQLSRRFGQLHEEVTRWETVDCIGRKRLQQRAATVPGLAFYEGW